MPTQKNREQKLGAPTSLAHALGYGKSDYGSLKTMPQQIEESIKGSTKGKKKTGISTSGIDDIKTDVHIPAKAKSKKKK